MFQHEDGGQIQRDLQQEVKDGKHPHRHAPTYPYLEHAETQRRQEQARQQAKDL